MSESPERVHGFDLELERHLAAMGSVGSRSARIWLRSANVRPLKVRLRAEGFEVRFELSLPRSDSTDHTYSLHYPTDFDGADPLTPSTCYQLRLELDDGEELTLEFETAPEVHEYADPFSIAVISCHQPFDPRGKLTETATHFLDKLPEAFEEHRVKRVLLMGDQVYADCPTTRSLFDDGYFREVMPRGMNSLFDCTREEVRRLFQDRHRLFFSAPGFKRLQEKFPCYPILDDHEIRDNFGSATEHRSARFAAIKSGALDAYVDYQASRLDIPQVRTQRGYHFEWDYGPVAGFVMDLRSHKRNDGERIQMFDSRQFHELRAFLERNRETPVVVLGLSVPLVHIPDWMVGAAALMLGEQSDAADRWSYLKAHGARDELFELLCEHQLAAPKQRLIIAAGDVHVGVAGLIQVTDTERKQEESLRMYQLVSSAVSNLESPVKTWAASLFPLMKRGLSVASDDSRYASRFDLLQGIGAAKQNPVPELNAGLIRVDPREGGYDVRIQLLAPGRDGKAIEVFSSGALG
ncbi:MAG: alkaline phosphatase family protein [Myxococcales bacterium]|nr:alkaline phosphatase family protein [Myxococcales bacterium]